MGNLERLIERLPAGCDGALILTPVNRHYFTGFRSSDGVLAVTRQGAAFYTDFRYIEAARAAIRDCPVHLIDRIADQLTAFFKEREVLTVAIEADGMTVAELAGYRKRMPAFEFLEDGRLSGVIAGLRMQKSPEEIAAIKRAQAITEESYLEVLETLRPGRTEREIALDLEMRMRKRGGEAVAFDFIVASGPGSAVPHWQPTDRPLARGDFVTMDIGIRVDGYCADMTRTVAIGSVTDEMRAVYDTVLQAQQAAFERIRPGIICKEVDHAARALIDRAGYPGCFGHSLGHSVGLEIHETPTFSPRCETILRPGMVLSVEPGIYLEGRFGVRIEDLIAVTETGFENLNRSDKGLLVL